MICSKLPSMHLGRLDLNIGQRHSVAKLLYCETGAERDKKKKKTERVKKTKFWEGRGEIPSLPGNVPNNTLVTSFEICSKART